MPELRAAAAAYKDHPRSRRSLLVFGHGDGGGGPTRGDARAPAPGARPGRAAAGRACATPEAFFDDLEADAQRPADGRRRALLRVPPRHLHVAGGGQARQPARRSARCRTRSCSTRCWATARGEARSSTRLWRVLLLNQFHDILPGHEHHRGQRARARGPRGGGARAPEAATAAVLGRRATCPCPLSGPAAARGGRATRTASSSCVALPGLRRWGASSSRTTRCGARALGTAPSCWRTRTCARVVGADGALRSLVHRATGREALAAPGNRLELYEDDPVAWDAWDVDPVAPRDAARLPAGRGSPRVARAPAACRGRLRAGGRRALAPAPDRPARRGRAPAGVPHGGRLAGGPPAAQGRLPVRRPRRRGDLRGRVRRGRRPDALLHRPRPRPLRGARPPLGGPRRARLRRRAADRLDVRLQRVRRDAAAFAAARAPAAGPGRRPRPPRVRLRRAPARGHLAGRRRRRRGDAPSTRRLRWAAGGRGRGRGWRRRARRARARRSSAPRTATGSCCGSTRPHGGRGAARRAAGRAGSRPRTRADLLEEPIGRRRDRAAARSSSRSGPWEIVTLRVSG